MAIPGLPALASDVVISAVELITHDVLSILGTFGAPQWGLFLDGEPAVIADNVLSFDFRQDMRISNYPIEEGAFESYNKVAVPFDVRLQFSTGGSIADRQELLQSIDGIIGSTDLFDAATPEKVYQGLNPIHQSIRRTSHNGVGLLVVDVYCQEVRVTATQQFANSPSSAAPSGQTAISGPGNVTTAPLPPISGPQSPSAAPQVSSGAVQPVTPTDAQVSQFSNAMPLP